MHAYNIHARIDLLSIDISLLSSQQNMSAIHYAIEYWIAVVPPVGAIDFTLTTNFEVLNSDTVDVIILCVQCAFNSL